MRVVESMRLTERDIEVLRELGRWRFCLGRHIRFLAGFASVRTADRRLNKLLEAEYIERKRVIYGIPGIYTLTAKGKAIIDKNTVQSKIRIEQIPHDIAVLDTVI